MGYRTLHVANAYSEYANLSPAVLIQRVHEDMLQKFKITASGQGRQGQGSRQEAKELQDFFQSLKKYSQTKNVSDIASSIDAEIIEQVFASIGKKYPAHFMRMITGTAQERGARFERELGDTVEAVLALASDQSGKNLSGSTRLGTSLVNVGTGSSGKQSVIDIDGMGAELVASVGQTVYNKMLKMDTKFAAVSGKIDISGKVAQVTITANPDTYLFRIGTLLSQANFTAKSYRSSYFNNRINMEIQAISNEIRLGNTDQRRVFTNIFSKAAGTPEPVSLSLYMYLKNTKNQKLKEAAIHLRFVYELTGYGQRYVDAAIEKILNSEGIGHANYFIYNDPATDNIYVESTAALIEDMWKHIEQGLQKGATSLSKSLFLSNNSAFWDLL